MSSAVHRLAHTVQRWMGQTVHGDGDVPLVLPPSVPADEQLRQLFPSVPTPVRHATPGGASSSALSYVEDDGRPSALPVAVSDAPFLSLNTMQDAFTADELKQFASIRDMTVRTFVMAASSGLMELGRPGSADSLQLYIEEVGDAEDDALHPTFRIGVTGYRSMEWTHLAACQQALAHQVGGVQCTLWVTCRGLEFQLVFTRS